MTEKDHSNNDESDRAAEKVRSVLFAADLNRLVRASKEDDDRTVVEIRRRYEAE